MNDCLNPTTADHIPRAMWAGNISAAASSNTQTTPITFPSGRFSRHPVVTVSPLGGNTSVLWRVDGVTTTSARLIFWRPDGGNLSGTYAFAVIAVQMEA